MHHALLDRDSQDVVPAERVVANYDEMRQFFLSSDLEFVRLSGETIGTAEVMTLHIPGVELDAGIWSWANLTRGTTSPRHTTFVMVPAPENTFFNGVPSRADLVHAYGPNTDLLDSSPPRVAFRVLSIETEALERGAEILGHDEMLLGSGEFATYSGQAAERLKWATEAFASIAYDAGSDGVSASTATCFRDRVIADALGTINRRTQPPNAARLRHLSALEIVIACDDYAAARRYKGITSLGLSRAAGYSERRIRVAFKEMTGVSPMNFIRARALHGIRRDLRNGAVTSVTEAAFMWGFTELGRFADTYRTQFGELPSETLQSVRHR